MSNFIFGRIFPVILLILGLLACNNPQVEPKKKDETSELNSISKDTCLKELRIRLCFDDHNFARADSLFINSVMIDSVFDYYLLALAETENPDEKLFINWRIGHFIFLDGEDLKAKNHLLNMLNQLADSDSITCRALLAEAQLLLGQVYLWIGASQQDIIEFPAYYYADSAILYMNMALEYYQNQVPVNYPQLANIFQSIGELYRMIQRNYVRAEEYYKRAQEIALTSPNISSFIKIENLYCLTTVNRDKGDYAKAEIFGKRLLEMTDSVGYKQYQSYAYSSLANICIDTKNFLPAKAYIELAIDLNLKADGSDSDLFIFYNNLAFVLIALDELEDALELCDQIIQMSRQSPSIVNELPTTYLHKAEVLEKLGEGRDALYFYHKCLKMRRNIYGERHGRVALVHDKIGAFHLSNRDIDSALFYFQEALIARSEEFSQMSYRKNPVLEDIQGKRDLITVLAHKSDALLAKYQSDDKDQSDLEIAFSCLQLSDSLIDESWESFLGEESKLLLESGVHPIYEKAIGIAYERFNISGNLQIGDEVFHFFEKNRYRYLLDNLSSEYAFEEAKVSDSLVVALKDVEYGLNYFGQEHGGSSKKTDMIANEIFLLTGQKEDIISQIEEEYPDFFRLKYSSQEAAWDDVRDFLEGRQTALIEFFFGQEYIFVLGTDGTEMSFCRVKRDGQLNYALETIIQVCSDPDPQQLMDSLAYFDYLNSSFIVYKDLLKETLEQNLGSQVNCLVIIPDGDLSKISFESLVTSQPSEANSSVVQEFLIYNYSVSYGFSSNILLSSAEPDKTRNKVLGFGYGSLETLGSEYSPLAGSNKELKAISRLFRGRFFEDNQATETNFKENVSDYGILHLALHGEADVENDDSTMLVFRKSEEESDDGFLLPYELYNQDLNARMVVLSSCQSGLGKAYKGEGVYSMARAFAYKGIPTLVSTLWPVHDEASAAIMGEFYRLLGKGKNIDIALREAKLHYLENAGSYLAHPAVWASYVPVGKMDNINIKRKLSTWFAR